MVPQVTAADGEVSGGPDLQHVQATRPIREGGVESHGLFGVVALSHSERQTPFDYASGPLGPIAARFLPGFGIELFEAAEEGTCFSPDGGFPVVGSRLDDELRDMD